MSSMLSSSISFSKVRRDPFWDVCERKEDKMHKIHAYPAKFPAFLTTKAIEFAKLNDLTPHHIADVFCGCGTVAFEAQKENIDFWGCDINPVATLIAEVKSHIYNAEKVEQYYQKILVSFNRRKNIAIKYDNANPRLRYWFDETSYNNLFKLKSSILSVTKDSSLYQKLFLCAFSNILKPVSKWLTKSIKPQIDPHKASKDVLESFHLQISFMVKAIRENTVYYSPKSTIKNMNFLDDTLKCPKVDMVVTSPPYVTSYEYADLHQLSSLWLDFTTDYRKLRQGSIGSVYHLDRWSISKGFANCLTTEKKVLKELNEKADLNKVKSVARYFSDMKAVISKIYSMLNSHGMVVFVIGNTEYKGVKIDNVHHLYDVMRKVGFNRFYITKRKIKNKFLTPYRDVAGKFSNNKKNRKIYAEEFILIGEKHG